MTIHTNSIFADRPPARDVHEAIIAFFTGYDYDTIDRSVRFMYESMLTSEDYDHAHIDDRAILQMIYRDLLRLLADLERTRLKEY